MVSRQVNVNMRKVRYVLSVGLAVATLAVVLAYALAGQVLLQSTYAEPGHNTIMSLLSGLQIYDPQMHDSPEPQMQGMNGQASEPPTHEVIGNNMLGGQATLPAGGLAAVVVTGAIILAVAAFVVSWKRKSFAVAGLLAASGVLLMIPPLIALANVNFAAITFQGPLVGAIFGFVILGLGIAKSIEGTRMTAETTATTITD
jgi:hypothetical protein